MDSPILKVRVPQELAEKVKTLSAQSGFTVSDILRACVSRALPYVEQKVKDKTEVSMAGPR